MPTPAERVYEAAAGKLIDQQAEANRIKSAVAPVAAIATAGALLVKPASDGFANAQLAQIAGLVVGAIGVMLMFWDGFRLLASGTTEGVPPEVVYATAESKLAEPESFHLEAAVDLDDVWRQNIPDIKKFGRWFSILVVGLVLELAGLGFAALIQPSGTGTERTAVAASLHLTKGRLGSNEMSLAGALAPEAHGRVRIAVSFLGRNGEVVSLHPSIHDGRFRTRISVTRDVAPLRMASYSITWAGSSSVAGAYLAGTIARCPGACR